MFPSKIQGKYQQAIHLWLKETHPENNISSSQQSVKYVLYAKKTMNVSCSLPLYILLKCMYNRIVSIVLAFYFVT